MTLSDFRAALVAFGAANSVAVYHNDAYQAAGDYLVWREDAQVDSIRADDGAVAIVIEGYLDFFTRTETDPRVDALQELLDGLDLQAWELYGTDYERDTRYRHYTWRWEMLLEGAGLYG